MTFKYLKSLFLYILFTTEFFPLSGQVTLPLGIHYQAVARDNFGKELANKEIDVRFSIISDNPLGTIAYQELHSKIITSKYGVFSLVIGHGTQTGGTCLTLSQISWSSALHFLKVEVKFESSFIDMGTMQFLAVPYALYAQKSLEPGPQGIKGDQGLQGQQGVQGPSGLKGDPGPQGLKGDTGPQGQQGVQGLKGDPGVKGDTGPQGQQGVQGLKGDPGVKGDTGPQGQQGVQGLKGDPGDPASDDQTLSFDGTNMTISDGNTVNLSTLMLPHQLLLLADTLSILYGNKVVLPNQIQDLQLDQDNKLKITKNTTATEIDFTRFLDDKQTLAFNSVDNTLNISGGNSVDLTPMKQDLLLTGNALTITNKTSPATIDLSPYLQSLNFTSADNKLYISGVAAPVDLTDLINDADADPLNEIQDLSLTNNILTVTNKTTPQPIDLSPYLQSLNFTTADNKLYISGVAAPVDLTDLKNDEDSNPSNEIQTLNFTTADNKLYISGVAAPVDLTDLKNDDDASTTNEIQDLTFDKNSGDLTISSKPPININYSIGFKAKKSTAQTGLTIGQTYPFINGEAEFIEGMFNNMLCYDAANGTFTVPSTGIYTFNIYYKADGLGSSRILTLLNNEVELEIIGPDISAGTEINKWVTYKLIQGDILRLTIYTGMSTVSGTGSFIGYKVN